MMDSGKWAQRGRRVRRSILAPLAALVVFVVAAFLLTVYVIEGQTRHADFNASLESVDTLVQQKTSAAAGLMQAVVLAMVTSDAIANAFAAEDRIALVRLAGPLFEGLQREHRVTHLYFTLPDLVNLLRLHDRDHHGDTIDRHTTRLAATRNVSASGIELGPLGTLTLRSVTPWRRDGRVIGYVELGKEIEPILVDAAASLGLELFAFIDKRQLDREAWERGRRLLGRATTWTEYGGYVLAAQSNPMRASLPRAAADALTREGALSLSDGGRTLALAALPLRDAAGRSIGKLLVISDRTKAQDTFTRWLALATVVSALAGILVFVSFSRALARVEADYRRQHELEHQLLRISGEHQRLIQVEKLSAVGTMMGEIAHQLNNPLVGVVNMAQLAERSVHDPERVRPLLAEIRKAGHDCGLFIKRMLDFTKASRFERKPCELAGVIDEALAVFRHSLGRRVAVTRRLPDEPVHLAIDPILMRHALFNLLSNAAQAMAGDGAVTVTLEPQGHDGRAGWRVLVDDTGPGLSEEVRQRLFTPFFTTRPEGTGLGLAVVMHVALLHEGAVEAENLPGGGARFAIWLPLDAATREAAP